MEEEIWKEIEGFDGMYEVSNMGRVRSWKTKCRNKKGQFEITRAETSLILKQNVNKDGYFLCNLKNYPKSVTKQVHRLVAEYFVENPLKLSCVDHIDGNIQNNQTTNLRWVSRGQNNLNSKKSQRNSSGIKGVCFHKTSNKWRSYWHENGKQRMKSFTTKEEAIVFRQMMVEEHYSKEHYIEDR